MGHKKKLERVRDELVGTYNAQVLEGLSSEEQDEVRDMVGDNETLQKLIRNYFLDKMPVADYLSGPFTLSVHWSEKYNKTIYIFGEAHGYKDACVSKAMPIQDYLYTLSKTTDAFIDFYLETSLNDMSDHFSWFVPAYIGKVRSKFAKCIRPKSRHAERCRLIRTHYVDIRQTNKKGASLVNLFAILALTGVTQSLPSNRKKVLVALPNLFEKKGMKEYVEEEYWKETRKEIERVTPKSAQTAIIRWMKKEISSVVKEHGNDISYFAYSLYTAMRGEKHHVNVSELKTSLVKLLFPLVSPVMDVYTLARTFKKFNTSKPPGKGKEGILWWRKPVGTWHQPTEPHNVIYYAGNNHASRIRGFLDKLGFKGKLLGKEASDRCLDMRGVEQPLIYR